MLLPKKARLFPISKPRPRCGLVNIGRLDDPPTRQFAWVCELSGKHFSRHQSHVLHKELSETTWAPNFVRSKWWCRTVVDDLARWWSCVRIKGKPSLFRHSVTRRRSSSSRDPSSRSIDNKGLGYWCRSTVVNRCRSWCWFLQLDTGIQGA